MISSAKTLLRRFLFAYSQISSSTFIKVHRPLLVGAFLVSVKYYLLIQANFSDIQNDNQTQGKIKSSFLSYFFLFAEIKQNKDDLHVLLYVALFINTALLGYFLTLVILSFHKIAFQVQLIVKLYCCYNYLFLLPSFYLGLLFLRTHIVPSLFLVIFAFSNGLISYSGGSSFDYERVDSLSKRNSKGYTLELLIDVIGIIIHHETDHSMVVYGYYFGLSTWKVVFYLIQCPYYYEEILKLNVQLGFVGMSTSLILLIQDGSYSTMTVLVAAPAAFALGSLLFNARLEQIIVGGMDSFKQSTHGTHQRDRLQWKKMRFIEIDVYCRYMSYHMPCFYSDYCNSKYAHYLEQIITDHISSCIDPETCYCSTIPEMARKMNGNDKVERERFLGAADKHKFLDDYLKSIYQIAISKLTSRSEKNQAYYSYFSFLGQVVKNYSTAFLEMQAFMQTQLQGNIGAVDHAVLLRESARLNESFFSHQNSRSSSTADTQRSRNSLFTIITFDEKLYALEGQFKECLIKKQGLLALVSESEIPLELLQGTLQSLFDSREVLNGYFKDILSFACYSSYLRTLCEAYQLCLKPSTHFVEAAKYIKKMQPNISRIPHYDDEACVAFVSLQPSTFNRIIKVSKNFYEVTKTFTNQEAIGKSIDFLMPKNLVLQHTALLKAHFKSEAIDLKISEKPNLIGQNSEGWAVHYSLKFQVSYIETMTDIGLSVWVKQIEDERLHIITDLSTSLKVHTISQVLFENLFSSILSSSQINTISISKWIPLLAAHKKIYESHYASKAVNNVMRTAQDEKVEISFDTILIKPNASQLDFKISEEHFFDDLMCLELFGITFNLVFVKNAFMNYLNITITAIEQLANFEDQQDFILRFKQQTLDFDIKFDSIQGGQQQQQQSISQITPSIFVHQQRNNSTPKHSHSRFKNKSKVVIQNNSSTFSALGENYHETEEEEDGENGTIAAAAAAAAAPPDSGRAGDGLYIALQDVSMQPSMRGQQSTRSLAGSFSQPLISRRNNANVQIMKDMTQFTNSMKQIQESTQDLIFDQSHTNLNIKLKEENSMIFDDGSHINRSALNGEHSFLNQSSRNYMKMSVGNTSNQFKKLALFQKTAAEGKISVSNSFEKKDNNNNNNHNNNLGTKGKRSETISQFKIKQNNKQSVAASGFSSEKSQRYMLDRFISKQNGLTGIQVINVLGGVSVLIIAIISVVSFINNFTQLQKDQENFEYVNWLNSINAAVSIVNTDLMIKANTEVGFFTLTAEAKADLMAALLVDMVDYDEIMRTLLGQMNQASSQNLIMFNELVGIETNLSLYSGTSTSIQTVPSTFVYMVITQAAYLTMQARQLDSKMAFQHNAELNFSTFSDLILQVTQAINERFSSQSESQKNTVVLWLFVFGGITLIFSLSVIPTFAFIINKQQQILYLFATFEPQKIDFMEENIIECKRILFGNYDKKGNKKVYESIRVAKKKKKNISNTIPLQPSYVKIVLIVTSFFIFIQMQPVTDYFLSSQFLEACANRYSLIVKVMNMQQVINEIIQARQAYVLARFNPTEVPLGIDYYQEFVRTTSVQSQQVYDEFFAIIANKDKYTTYETELMENFFYAAIENDACTTIDAYPQYQGGITFDLTTCQTSNKGVLSSGVSIAMNDFVTGLVTFYAQSLGTDDAVFLTQVNQFFTSMRDRFYAKKYMTNSLEVLIIFLKIINFDQYSNQMTVLQILITWQLISIILTFFLGFTRYSQYIQAQVQQTKEFIGLIEVPVLIYNPYILSYLRSFQ